MNNKQIKWIPLLFIAFWGLFLFGCKKVKVGHLDTYLYYPQNPMTVQQGRPFKSFAINPNGSTRPMHVELMHIYNKSTGENVDKMFNQKYPFPMWTASYDPETDTTLKMVSAIQKVVDTPAMWIDPVSGQLIANFNTIYLDTGDYVFDLKISNVYGSKIYPKIGEFLLVSAPAFEKDPEIGTTSNTLRQKGDENNTFGAEAPIETIVRLADSPNIIVLKFVDKNGTPFNPLEGEVIKRRTPGNANDFYQNLGNFSFKQIITDTSINYIYALVPFPLSGGTQGYAYYNRIPAEFIEFNNAPGSAEWSANPRWVGRFFLPGKYEVVIQFPDGVHK